MIKIIHKSCNAVIGEYKGLEEFRAGMPILDKRWRRTICPVCKKKLSRREWQESELIVKIGEGYGSN